LKARLWRCFFCILPLDERGDNPPGTHIQKGFLTDQICNWVHLSGRMSIPAS
jgi:hypothetical protein